MKRGRRALNGLDDEIRDHIERETREDIDRGIAPEEARRLALVQFGNVALRPVLEAARRTIASLAPDVVVRKATTMREVLDASIGPAREVVLRPAPGVESHRGTDGPVAARFVLGGAPRPLRRRRGVPPL